jgi:hypothetical protein
MASFSTASEKTALYNALEDVKSGAPLNQSQGMKDRDSVLILKDIHEQIDALVASAYGWSTNMDDGGILINLVRRAPWANPMAAARLSNRQARWIGPSGR